MAPRKPKMLDVNGLAEFRPWKDPEGVRAWRAVFNDPREGYANWIVLYGASGADDPVRVEVHKRDRDHMGNWDTFASYHAAFPTLRGFGDWFDDESGFSPGRYGNGISDEALDAAGFKA